MKCGAPRASTGDPCQRDVAPGFTRCNLHGGANPSAKIKAEQALAQARLPACEALFDIIEKWDRARCPTCGFPSGDTDVQKVIIRAAQVILDRTGLGPRATLELAKQSDGDLDLDLLTDAEMAELDALLGQVRTLKTQIKMRLGMVDPLHVAQPAQEM